MTGEATVRRHFRWLSILCELLTGVESLRGKRRLVVDDADCESFCTLSCASINRPIAHGRVQRCLIGCWQDILLSQHEQ
ncbi:hypothetical protein BZA70DRAFT_58153 [Myxozyma melibiosi]|uniref:Secreted protein n=1 Tax=Myxozyma melibiosi TaxID=54550 RepID=A0ABR1F1J4_9ASCO